MTRAIRTEGLVKSCGGVRALDGVDLEVSADSGLGHHATTPGNAEIGRQAPQPALQDGRSGSGYPDRVGRLLPEYAPASGAFYAFASGHSTPSESAQGPRWVGALVPQPTRD